MSSGNRVYSFIGRNIVADQCCFPKKTAWAKHSGCENITVAQGLILKMSRPKDMET